MKLAAFVTALALALSSAGPALAQDGGDSRLDQAIAMIDDDPKGARAILEELSQGGDAEAMNSLAALVEYDNDNWPGDPARASALREDALRGGSKAAALNIALRIMMDSGGDHARGIELLRIAETEEQMRPIASYGWGRAYLFGWGVERDMAKGVQHFEAFLASKMGSGDFLVDTHFLLGRAYRNGWDVDVDPDKAFHHFLIAADNEDRRAQWNVGMMLLTGEGVAADEARAYDYVRRSAEAEYLDGMVSHAVMLALGQGVAEDDEAARDWYYEAVLLGSAHAMRGLGMMLVIGEGGDAMPELGVALLQLAAEAGEQDAVKLLGMIPEDAVDPSDVADARAAWLEDHAPPDPVD